MKYIIILLFFSQTIWAQRIDFVIDIDGVIVDRANKQGVKHLYPPDKIRQLKLQNRILELNGHVYVLNNGAREFIEYLSQIPDAKITFFSTGPKERNLTFLKSFKTSSGRSFLEAAEGRLISYDGAVRIDRNHRPYRSADFDDKKFSNPLTKNYQSNIHEFIGPVKKDITVIEGLDLERAILIEDRITNATGGQEKNLLKVDISLTRVKPRKIKEFTLKAANKVDDPIARHFYNWNNRLMLTAGVIDEVIEKSKVENISVSQALWETQWEKNQHTGKLKNQLLRNNAIGGRFENGNKIFSRVNPSFRPVNFHFPYSVNQMLDNLIK